MLCFVCVSKLEGEPLVNKWLFIVYEQFNEVRCTQDSGKEPTSTMTLSLSLTLVPILAKLSIRVWVVFTV